MISLTTIYPDPVVQPKTLGMGDRIYRKTADASYIIARVGSGLINLINLDNGNCFLSQPVSVASCTELTADEVDALTGSSKLKEWELLQSAERGF